MDKDRFKDTRRPVQGRAAFPVAAGVCGIASGVAQGAVPRAGLENPHIARGPHDHHSQRAAHAYGLHGAGHAHHAHRAAHAMGQTLARETAPALAQKVGREVAQELRENIQENVQDSLEAVFEAVFPKIAALVGEGFERKAFREEMARYLVEQGVPSEAVAAMNRAYELELATKAMLFDKMQTARAEADAKLDGIPAVHAPRRASLPEADGKRRARAALKKNPNSTEALAALFAEM